MAGVDQSNREKEIFEQALDIESAEERLSYLKGACGEDGALLKRLEALLHADQTAESFLPDKPQSRPTINLEIEKPGDRIGRYKLLQQIGEGGCGVVYMAEQEEPVRRRVALKVIKLGMDTKSVIARFEAERQALALMDHPNIAKVLDAGATEAGRPYFVMELVRGTKITNYCDEHKLPTRERLDLFIQVCHAIQHAHQKGVIHRDIKPSNILVTLRDGVPVPKVIDFGIAKATTDQRLTDKTLFTAFEQFLGTPAYMSPEQAEMNEMGIDTRSDIYSLGVLLYELLTGQTPFDAKELLQSGLDAMRRTIREKEPARPSTRLSTLLAGELTSVAAHRQTDPPKLIHVVRGELDWIVMKSLEKDRARRYETANGLARDVQRYLADEAVVACPPSNLYRLQKLVRRNKLAFAAASAVTAALVIGLGVSTWMFFNERAAYKRAVAAEQQADQARVSETVQRRQAEEARAAEAKLRQQAEADKKRAQTEAAKSQQVAQFLKDMLKGVGPSVALGRDTKMLREILDKTAERVGKDLTNQPSVEAELLSTIGNTFFELTEFQKAEAMQREALRLRRTLFGETNEFVATSLHELALVLDGEAKTVEAETTFREALAIRRKLFGNEHRDVAYSLAYLAGVLTKQGKLAEAEHMFRETLRIAKKLLGNEHLEVASCLTELGFVLAEARKLAEAEAMHREALAIRRKLLSSESPAVAQSLVALAFVLTHEGKLNEVDGIENEAIALCKKLLTNEWPDLASVCARLGSLLRMQGRFAEAEIMLRAEVTMRSKLYGNENPAVARARDMLCSVLVPQGKLTEAEAIYRDDLAILRKRLGNEHRNVAHALNGLANVLRNEGKLAEAESMHREALSIRRKVFGNEHLDVANSLANLAYALQLEGKLAEAETSYREALAMQRKLLGNDHPEVAISLTNLAYVLQRQGKVAEAESMHREALAKQTQWHRKTLEEYRKAAESGAAQSLNNLAWMLATCVDSEIRDGPGAVNFAEKAVAATNRKDPNMLDTLAAAYAETSNFEKAGSIQKEAMALLVDEKRIKDYASRLKLYESNSPYREHH